MSMLAWPSHVTFVRCRFASNEKSGSTTRSSWEASAALSLSLMPAPSFELFRCRRLLPRLRGAVAFPLPVEVEGEVTVVAASSMHGSVSSPHSRLSHVSLRVGLCQLGQGLRKPVRSSLAFALLEVEFERLLLLLPRDSEVKGPSRRGRVAPGVGLREGR